MSQLDTQNSFIETVLTTGFMGVPTVLAGMNIREKRERKLRKRIVNHIGESKQVTVGQIANSINLSGQEVRDLLNSLVKEERIDITNRSSDMAVVYIPAN